MRRLIVALVLLVSLVRATDTPWPNPMMPQRADPHLTRHTDGWYYFTATVPEYDRLELRRAKAIAGLASAAPKTICSPTRYNAATTGGLRCA